MKQIKQNKTFQIAKENSIICSYVADCFPKNKNNIVGKLEEQITNYIQTSKFSKNPERGGNIQPYNGLTKKSSVNFDNRVPESVQKIRENHKLQHECQGKLKDEIDSERTNPSRGKNPKRDLPKSLAFTTAIGYSNAVTKLRIEEIHIGLQIY